MSEYLGNLRYADDSVVPEVEEVLVKILYLGLKNIDTVPEVEEV